MKPERMTCGAPGCTRWGFIAWSNPSPTAVRASVLCFMHAQDFDCWLDANYSPPREWPGFEATAAEFLAMLKSDDAAMPKPLLRRAGGAR